MTSFISHTTIDCRNAYELSEWWKPVLGYVDLEGDPNLPGHEECMIRDPETGHQVLFIEVPDAKQVKNRIHFDLRARARAPATRSSRGCSTRRHRGADHARHPRSRHRLGGARRPRGQRVLHPALARPSAPPAPPDAEVGDGDARWEELRREVGVTLRTDRHFSHLESPFLPPRRGGRGRRGPGRGTAGRRGRRLRRGRRRSRGAWCRCQPDVGDRDQEGEGGGGEEAELDAVAEGQHAAVGDEAWAGRAPPGAGRRRGRGAGGFGDRVRCRGSCPDVTKKTGMKKP